MTQGTAVGATQMLDQISQMMTKTEEKGNCQKAGSFGKKLLDTLRQQKKLALQVQKKPTN